MAVAQQNETRTSQVKPRYFRVRVVDNTKGGRPAVNVRMPIPVVKWGMQMAQALSPKIKDVDIDWSAVTAMIDSGAEGELVHVEDEAEHKTVDVWIE